MYIESKAGGLTGPTRIGRVTFSKTGATLYYAGKSFQSLKGSGSKSNYFEVESGKPYWISGPRKDGQGSLYATNVAPEIDEDVRNEYWFENQRPTSTHAVEMRQFYFEPSVPSFTYPPVLRTGSNTRPAKARRRPHCFDRSARYCATPNPSIERTVTSGLRPLVTAAHVKR